MMCALLACRPPSFRGRSVRVAPCSCWQCTRRCRTSKFKWGLHFFKLDARCVLVGTSGHLRCWRQKHVSNSDFAPFGKKGSDAIIYDCVYDWSLSSSSCAGKYSCQPHHPHIKMGLNFFMLDSGRVLVGTPSTQGAGVR